MKRLDIYYVCGTALLDIPIVKSKIEALHLLFSLYLEFKNSQVIYICLPFLPLIFFCRACYLYFYPMLYQYGPVAFFCLKHFKAKEESTKEESSKEGGAARFTGESLIM